MANFFLYGEHRVTQSTTEEKIFKDILRRIIERTGLFMAFPQ